jgi:hypothetical protein
MKERKMPEKKIHRNAYSAEELGKILLASRLDTEIGFYLDLVGGLMESRKRVDIALDDYPAYSQLEAFITDVDLFEGKDIRDFAANNRNYFRLQDGKDTFYELKDAWKDEQLEKFKELFTNWDYWISIYKKFMDSDGKLYNAQKKKAAKSVMHQRGGIGYWTAIDVLTVLVQIAIWLKYYNKHGKPQLEYIVTDRRKDKEYWINYINSYDWESKSWSLRKEKVLRK